MTHLGGGLAPPWFIIYHLLSRLQENGILQLTNLNEGINQSVHVTVLYNKISKKNVTGILLLDRSSQQTLLGFTKRLTHLHLCM